MNCPLCQASTLKKIGIRGNREYFGANRQVFPHLVTNVTVCTECSFIFCRPKLEAAKILESEHYNFDVSNLCQEDQVNLGAYAKGFKTILKYKPSGAFLDVGAGKGGVVRLAEDLGFESKGIEPSAKSCIHALDYFKVHLFNGILHPNFPWPDKKFDVVSLFHVLEHVDDPKYILEIIRNRLSQEGIVYIEVPNGAATLLQLADLFFSMTGKGWSTRLSPLHPPFHSVAFTPKSIRYLLERGGYSILELGTFSSYSRCRSKFSGAGFFVILIRNFLSWFLSFLPNGEIVYAVASVTNVNSPKASGSMS
jgi:SAM-dependent methyltransferase